MTTRPVVARIQDEQNQTHLTRVPLFDKIADLLQRPLITYFTSFGFPVMMESADADALEETLACMDLSKGLALCINSPGGDGLAAERIINICRSYSGTKEYWVLVPGRAKSAATMVCFGASKIIMGPTSELGPVDPQIRFKGQILSRLSIYNVVQSYRKLFRQAVATKGQLPPYLQQLANYDAREIAEFEKAIELSNDISVKALASGMMKGESPKAIKKKIDMFLTPLTGKVHGRAIHRPEAKGAGLNVEEVNPGDELWASLYELYVRTNHLVSSGTSMVAKCIETRHHSFAVQVEA